MAMSSSAADVLKDQKAPQFIEASAVVAALHGKHLGMRDVFEHWY